MRQGLIVMHMMFSGIIILCDSPSGADIGTCIKLMSATDLKNKMIMCMIAVLDMGALHIINLRVITDILIIIITNFVTTYHPLKPLYCLLVDLLQVDMYTSRHVIHSMLEKTVEYWCKCCQSSEQFP